MKFGTSGSILEKYLFASSSIKYNAKVPPKRVPNVFKSFFFQCNGRVNEFPTLRKIILESYFNNAPIEDESVGLEIDNFCASTFETQLIKITNVMILL